MNSFKTAALVLLMSVTVTPSWAQSSVADSVDRDWPYLETLYQYLHQFPELSFQEQQTASRIAAELERVGIAVTRDVGGHGVVGMLSNGPGPTLMIRADLDGLPIKEMTGVPYASQVTQADRDGKDVPVMHACGHDVHMSVLIGTARRLVDMKSQWQGTIMFVGQPAEERSGGAKAMLAEGLFERFARPDYNLALHVSSSMQAGTVGAVSGYHMANVDSVDIVVRGQGGHGAYPERSRDPVVAAAGLVQALQTIVSREISPREPAVVTVGSIHGGTQHNIIPNEVKLQLTLRSYSSEVREQTLAAIERLAAGIAMVHRLPSPQITVLDEHTPAAYNEPQLTARVVDVFEQTFGAAAVIDLEPEMVGEDFGRYGAVEPSIPSLMFRLGTVHADRFAMAEEGQLVLPGLHSAEFAPDPKPTISTGIEAMTRAALEILGED